MITDELVDRLREHLLHDDEPIDADKINRGLRDIGVVLGAEAFNEVSATIRAQIMGAGPLQQFVDAPEVTDVLVDGLGQVWIDRGRGCERIDIDLGDIRSLAVRLATSCGSRLDDSQPVVDGRLPDGTRMHAVLPPVSSQGTVISLRTVRPQTFSLDDLVHVGMIHQYMAPLIRAMIDSRVAFLVSGSTGSGKTTLLSALLSMVPTDERIVLVEETAELMPNHPHVIHLTVRRENVEGVGEITASQLVRESLRMRPDRLVVGECRGEEVKDMLAAMNTGHEGGCGTLHANSPSDIPARLEALGALAGLSRDALAAQASSAIEAVLHLRKDKGARRISNISVVRRNDGLLSVEDAVTWDGVGTEPTIGEAWGELARRCAI